MGNKKFSGWCVLGWELAATEWPSQLRAKESVMSTTDHTSLAASVVPAAASVASASSAVGFERCKAEIDAAASGPLAYFNVDVLYAVRVMLTVCGNAALYREELAKLGLDEVDRLEPRAQALSYAHALHGWKQEKPVAIDALAAEVQAHRRVLNAELELMRLRGHIAKHAVTLQGTTGYLAVAQDVRTIASAFFANWDTVGPQIGNAVAHVNDALVAADQLIAAMAQDAEVEEKLVGSALQRAAAYTLAFKSYRAIHRGIQFIRYEEGDVDEIVPSLYEHSRPRKKAVVAPAAAPAELVEPVVAVENGASTGEGASHPNIPAAPMTPSKLFE